MWLPEYPNKFRLRKFVSTMEKIMPTDTQCLRDFGYWLNGAYFNKDLVQRIKSGTPPEKAKMIASQKAKDKIVKIALRSVRTEGQLWAAIRDLSVNSGVPIPDDVIDLASSLPPSQVAVHISLGALMFRRKGEDEDANSPSDSSSTCEGEEPVSADSNNDDDLLD
jgi:hypothetical protein